MSGRERRLCPRWTLHAAIDVESDAGRWAGISYDVSAGGIFVATHGAPELGVQVAVTVMLPDGTRLLLAGAVRWVRPTTCASPGLPAGFGIEWDYLPMDALRALLHFAELREPLLSDVESELKR
ncbi:MAG TPA: PilZ domain-containing protein [Polyangia bacterium]